MKTMITLIIIFCLFIQGCFESAYNNLSGKCAKAKKKRQSCLVSALLLCEKIYPPYASGSIYIDNCTHPDALLFPIEGLCSADYENLYCTSGSSSENRNNKNNR